MLNSVSSAITQLLTEADKDILSPSKGIIVLKCDQLGVDIKCTLSKKLANIQGMVAHPFSTSIRVTGRQISVSQPGPHRMSRAT